ncbi:hypothetical protein [Actinacidiphila soli]|uniref:hypothetical protein n=1 Tax=Actinacidiphila soli TaxID=2487275 RepID=UPI000FCA0CD6|nr:hypothetical protein [Actinacidiphila soli]
MIQTAGIREWRNHNVIDPKGHKIGAPEEIHVDTTAEDRPWPRSGLPAVTAQHIARHSHEHPDNPHQRPWP